MDREISNHKRNRIRHKGKYDWINSFKHFKELMLVKTESFDEKYRKEIHWGF